MDLDELKEKLDDIGIPDEAYSLDGSIKTNAVHLIREKNKWEVFFCDEDGEKNKISIFDNEHNACEHIYKIFWLT